jgi:transposase
MWATRSRDCCLFEIDASRSREVAKHTIGEGPVVVTSDMLKAYEDLGDNVTNSWCWAHVRRYLLKLNTRPNLLEMSNNWVSKVDWLYHCNNERLAARNDQDFELHDKALRASMAEFKRLVKSNAKRSKDPEAKKVFKMISEHWDGLEVFVDLPQIPMDNNLTEQALRNLVVGRKCYYGSGSLWSGQFAADLSTIFTTLEMNGINPQVWLTEYLSAVAKNGGRAPPNSIDFLPWNTPPSQLLLT